MARSHIEFIQSQVLAWQPCHWPHVDDSVNYKMLSEDTDSGGCSTIVNYPAGWNRGSEGFLQAAEELFVLEGSLQINDTIYQHNCYAYLPAGFPRSRVASPDGAIVLTFFDTRSQWKSGTPGKQEYDESKAILIKDAYDMSWSHDDLDPVYAEVGLRWKILRHDPENEDACFLLMTPPHLHPQDWKGPQESHDCVEEMFLISGDFLSNVGLMCEGAYFWRPPEIAHGPYGSSSGNLTLIRTLGDKLVNNWTDYEVTISREPEYKPFLPQSFDEFRDKPWQRPPRY